MFNLGDFSEDATIHFKFSTSSLGAPTTLSGSPSLAIYKAGGTTEITSGITLTVDFDSVTGLNHVEIDLSASADYATGNDYDVVIAAGTVSGTSVVGLVVGHFSIENRYMSAARSELAAVPAASASLGDKLNWLAALALNKITQTTTTQTLRNNADSGSIGASAISDDGSTFTRGKFS